MVQSVLIFSVPDHSNAFREIGCVEGLNNDRFNQA